jgi:hypothetical protein
VSEPLIAAGLSELRHGRFSFYPAIVGVEHNEWLLRRANWTDVVVANAKTSEELCILGDLSARFFHRSALPDRRTGEGTRISRRHRDTASPYRPRNAARGERIQPDEFAPRPISATRRRGGDPGRDWRRFTFLARAAGSIAAGILICLAVIFVVRDAQLGTRFGWTSTPPRLPALSDQDDYASVIKKLGTPASDRWLPSGSGGYRRLWYPRKGVTIILTGATRESARYAATLNRDEQIVQSAMPGLVKELDMELNSSPVLR